jgi:hypothetical protein
MRAQERTNFISMDEQMRIRKESNMFNSENQQTPTINEWEKKKRTNSAQINHKKIIGISKYLNNKATCKLF